MRATMARPRLCVVEVVEVVVVVVVVVVEVVLVVMKIIIIKEDFVYPLGR